METLLRVSDSIKSFRVRISPSVHTKGPQYVLYVNFQETRLSALRPPTEFFDFHRISRPADLNQATSVSRIILFSSDLLNSFHSEYHIILVTFQVLALYNVYVTSFDV